MASHTFNVLHICLAVLVGLYVGINLSSLHTIPSATTTTTTGIEGHSKHLGKNRKDLERELLDLRQIAAETKRWRSKATQYETDYKTSQNRIHQLEESCNNNAENNNNQETTNNATATTNVSANIRIHIHFVKP